MIKIYRKKGNIILLIILLILSILFSEKFNINFNSNSIDINFDNINNVEDEMKESFVVRVIDGDTIILNINGIEEKVRLIGINTPESKKVNNKVVECFGKEASNKASKILFKNKIVYFENDQTQSKRDIYGRLLGYIFLENGQNFAEKIIKDGYGYEYTYKGLGYKYQDQFKKAEVFARENKSGLWAEGVCR